MAVTKSAKQIAIELRAYAESILALANKLDPHDEQKSEYVNAGIPFDEPKPKRVTKPRLSLSTLSVAARDMRGPFSVAELALKIGYPRGTVQVKVQKLAERGTLNRTGGARGPSVRYEFVKPTGKTINRASVTDADDRKIGVGSASRATGKQVGTTGKTKGRSHKKLVDSRRQRAGHKLKKK